ncbi:dienelactone hydrolase family protein [Pseudonocardia sp. KRD-169]|uniref:Dienelactone hydrolase family protein n=2 Tax=Pseudonocardia abyssalis TaxID=2792008 RepID=A0ABS6UVI6_9PSEU|nr:dienelactone hydrolase family protein [Pseudonocardia abyssalis]MBW0136294.1 dienelactone hydrolase family protein [Pseudonocardia abyssalis]
MSVTIRHPERDGPSPVVVVYHDGPGLREDIHDVTRRLADAGYYAVLPDLYHRIGPRISFDMAGIGRGPGSPEFERLMAAVGSLDDVEVLADTAAMLDLIAKDPAAGVGAKAAMGFCVGARLVFRLLAADPDGFAAGAAMHPSFCVTDDPDSPHRSVGDISAELFVGFGAADTLASLELNQPLRQELARPTVNATVEVFDGADHGFMFPRLPSYDEHAASTSWDRTLAMYHRALVDR